MVLQELRRILGDRADAPGHTEFFELLPLVSDRDAIDFLRTVPAGADFDELPALASAYRATHPVVLDDLDDEDPEAAG